MPLFTSLVGLLDTSRLSAQPLTVFTDINHHFLTAFPKITKQLSAGLLHSGTEQAF